MFICSEQVASRVLLSQDFLVKKRIYSCLLISVILLAGFYFIFYLIFQSDLSKKADKKVNKLDIVFSSSVTKKQVSKENTQVIKARTLADKKRQGVNRLASGAKQTQVGKIMAQPQIKAKIIDVRNHQAVERAPTIRQQVAKKTIAKPKTKSRPKPLPKITNKPVVEKVAQAVRGLQHNLPVASMKSEDALYLLAWRHQVEAVGNRLYSQIRDQGLEGELKLLVAINTDGSLRHVVLKQSSGNPALDAFALEIVERSAPFAPFTANMAEQTQVLEITRVWRFELDSELDML